MANNPSTLPGYNGQTDAPDLDYPFGSARDDAIPGDLSGTPRIAAELKDLQGMQQALISQAGITPSGNADTALVSQYLDAMRKLLGGVEVNDAAMVARDYKIGVLVLTQGRTTVGDGDRAAWLIVAGATGTPDGVSFIDLANGNQAQNLRLSSDNVLYLGASLTTTVTGMLDDITATSNITRSLSLAKINVAKVVNPWGMQAPINNLGDSICHGAFAGDLYYNGITRILSRMLGGDYGGLSYQGYVPMLTLDSGGPNESKDIHAINFVGTWNAQDSSTTVNGAAAYNGLTFQSVTTLDRITSTIPTFQSQALVWYLQQPGGGELTISDNTGVLTVVATAGALAVKSELVALVDNGQGSAVLQAQKTDANGPPVDVMGFGYIENVTTPVMHNFSQSGRRLRWVDDQIIVDMAKSASVFMLSLGHNDQGDVDADPGGAYGTVFTAKIDKIIAECNLNETQLIVNDFLWTTADTSFTRQELKRAADETNGMYIPFPNLIKLDGEVPDSTYLTSTLKMWVDASHPNAAGNKWIAEVIAKYMGLSVTSKQDAIAHHDYWMPFDIPVSGTLGNSFSAPASVSAYRINGEEVNFRIAVQNAPGGAFPVSVAVLQTAWRVTPPFSAIGTSHDLPGLINRTTGAMTSTVILDLGGSVSLQVNATYINDQSCLAKLPIVLD